MVPPGWPGRASQALAGIHRRQFQPAQCHRDEVRRAPPPRSASLSPPVLIAGREGLGIAANAEGSRGGRRDSLIRYDPDDGAVEDQPDDALTADRASPAAPGRAGSATPAGHVLADLARNRLEDARRTNSV